MHLQYAQNENVQHLSPAPRPIPQRISNCESTLASASEQLAIVDSRGSWTGGQLEEATSEMESWFQYLGIRAGDRIMIVAEDCRALIAMVFALVRIQANPFLVNANLSPQEVDRLKTLSEPRRIFYTNVSQNARTHATRHAATVANHIDWGPIGFGPLNENAKAKIVNSRAQME